MELPEVIVCACATGSDVTATGTFCTTTIVVVQDVSLRMTDRTTRSNVTTESWGSRTFFGCLTGNDVTRSAKKKIKKGREKSTGKMKCFITSHK